MGIEKKINNHNLIRVTEFIALFSGNLSFHFNSSARPILGDIRQIQQITMNLIANASESLGDSNGEITIETGEMYCNKDFFKKEHLFSMLSEGTYAFIEVRDSGCGIDTENIDKIFDPFFTTKFTGRGLGLAVALGIARAHNGAIIVESTPGRGTNVRVLFPVINLPLNERS
ncbi:MAG: ATP-binding protein [Spirochaetes bacterium]|nr:ATP-binding protein [Spirochaetota bacterium]